MLKRAPYNMVLITQFNNENKYFSFATAEEKTITIT